MNGSMIKINDEYLEVKTITYYDGNLSIKTTNDYMLNIDLNFDITKLSVGKKENISNKINTDQNFVTEKYSYVIDIGNDIYLTKNEDNYLLEVNIEDVNILIPPYDSIKGKRLESNYSSDIVGIRKINAKVYFK